MSVDTPVLVLPGIGNSGPQHWQTLWELRHPDWRRVNLDHWDSPVCDEWVRALDVAVQACPSPPLLVAHSLACLLVAHWASCVPTTVKGALFVAIPEPGQPLGHAIRQEWARKSYDPLGHFNGITAAGDPEAIRRLAGFSPKTTG